MNDDAPGLGAGKANAARPLQSRLSRVRGGETFRAMAIKAVADLWPWIVMATATAFVAFGQ